MGFMFSGLFWGILLIVVGLIIIVKMIFKIDIPVGRILFSFFFIYLGISILIGGFGHKSQKRIMFDEQEIDVCDYKINDDDNEYSVVFGKGNINLANIDINETTKIGINVTMGEAVVLIDSDMPIKIRASAAFGSVRLPDGNEVNFGHEIFTTPSYDREKDCIKIKVNVAFGAIKFKTVKKKKSK